MIDRTPFDPERTRIRTEGGGPSPEPIERSEYVQTFTEALRRPHWWERAACRGVDVSEFFPPPGDLSPRDDPRRKYCDGCQVRTECLEAALAVPDRWDRGIFGGTYHKERREIRRAREAALPELPPQLAGLVEQQRPLPREHGTDRGYYQHRRNHEPSCSECRLAHNEVTRDQKRHGRGAA